MGGPPAAGAVRFDQAAGCDLKTVDLTARPIHHRTADRVPAQVLLRMLGYRVEWHCGGAACKREPSAPFFRRPAAAVAVLLGPGGRHSWPMQSRADFASMCDNVLHRFDGLRYDDTDHSA